MWSAQQSTEVTILLDDYFKTNPGVKDLPWLGIEPRSPSPQSRQLQWPHNEANQWMKSHLIRWKGNNFVMSCISDRTVQTSFSHSGRFAKCFEMKDAIVSPWSGLWISPAQSPSTSMMQVPQPLPSLPSLLRLFRGSIMPWRNALLGSDTQLCNDNRLWSWESLQI